MYIELIVYHIVAGLGAFAGTGYAVVKGVPTFRYSVSTALNWGLMSSAFVGITAPVSFVL